jgi:phage-related protein
MGSSKKDLVALPALVVDVFGYGLYLAQTGRRHENSKVLRGFGDASVVEIVESGAGGTYRAAYTVRFECLCCMYFRRNPSQVSPRPNLTWN